MERWEIIEGKVLIALVIGLMAFCAWALVHAQLGVIVVLLLPPVIFRVFWLVLYETSSAPARRSRAGSVPCTAPTCGAGARCWGIALALGAATAGMLLVGKGLTAALWAQGR